LIRFDIIMGEEDEKMGFWVFDWENGVYEFQIDEGDNKRKILFFGDISYLKETLEKILEEIKRNTRIKNK